MATKHTRPRLLGLAQVAQHVRDIAKARAFYRGFLGCEEPFTFSHPDGSLRAALVKIDECQSVQLLPGAAPAGGSLDHFGLETDDAEAMRLYLKSRGISVPDQVQKGKFTACFFRILDPEGHTVEFMQFRPESWTIGDLGLHLPATRLAQHLAYVGLPARQPEPTAAFYHEVLGLAEMRRSQDAAGRLAGIHLRVPDGSDGIVLRARTGPETATIHDLGFRVAKRRADDRRPVHTVDPDGIPVELLES